jgi:LacI family transcriptional regulator
MEKRSSYTMADVARLAGVSVSTVSNVLNNQAIVSPELTGRVRKAIEALGFSPNSGARSLRMGQTRIIGMVIPDITNPFYGQITGGVEEAAIKNGYELMVLNSKRQPDLERRHLNALRAQRVEGILLNPCNSYTARDVLLRNHPPIVFVDCVPLDSKASCIVTNNFEAAHEATRYLIGLGHRRIAIITAELTYSTMIERMEGYQRAMQEAGIPIRSEYTRQSATEVESGHRCGLSLFRLPEPPTAIFSLNNRIGLGILRALKELDIPCPERVSVMIFDDPDWASVFSPSLTAIEQPAHKMGMSAVQLLLKSIRSAGGKAEDEAQRVQLESRMHIRESTGPAPRNYDVQVEPVQGPSRHPESHVNP